MSERIWMAGEREALAEAQRLGSAYGYGNLIDALKEAWERLLTPQVGADAAEASTWYCPWCGVDCRTGMRGRRLPPGKKARRVVRDAPMG
jgi:hypothetical protein